MTGTEPARAHAIIASGRDRWNDQVAQPGSSESGWTKFQSFWSQYVWEGQHLNTKGTDDDTERTFFMRHRRWLGPLIPAVFVHLCWWSVFASKDLFYLYNDRGTAPGIPNFYVAITMIFGSLVAGATSEGGGAVAFPVMTLALDIKPPVARDFTFMIQSVGMTSASVALLLMRVRMEMRSLLYGSIGGAIGIIVGLEAVSPHLPPPFAKMYFVSVFLTFAFALYLTNKQRDRQVFEEIPLWTHASSFITLPGICCQLHWKAAVLVCGGFVGGLFSAVGGSGLDIASFSVLTLLFRVSEKTATPTSIVLMAINSLVGFAYRQLAMGGIEADAWPYFAVAIPIVCIGAPVGSMLGSHCHRLVLAGFVYVLDVVQFIGALVVVQPWTTERTDQPLLLCLSSAAVAVVGSLVFRSLARKGASLADSWASATSTSQAQGVDACWTAPPASLHPRSCAAGTSTEIVEESSGRDLASRGAAGTSADIVEESSGRDLASRGAASSL